MTEPDSDVEFVRVLVQQVIDRLGPGAPALRIDRIGYYHGFDEERFEDVLSEEPSDRILVAVRAADPAESPMDAYFSLGAPREDAIATTATSIQDHVLDHTQGEPLPPCPVPPAPVAGDRRRRRRVLGVPAGPGVLHGADPFCQPALTSACVST